MYLLDTNVISELRRAKSGKADRHVRTWAESVAVTSMHLSAITLLELEVGILKMQRHDSFQGALLRHWLEDHVKPTFATRVLDVDSQVALRCASLHVPNPRSYRDSLIAATALVHGMTVVTRNVFDFKDTGAALFNPWQS